MTKKEYIDQVLTLMNEAGMNERLSFQLAGADNSEIINQIIATYPNAYCQSLAILPRTWWPGKKIYQRPIDKGDGSGYLPLPHDYHRLHSFRMKGWKNTVFDALEETHPLARMQTVSLYTRGTATRPVCVISIRFIGNHAEPVLHYYSLPHQSKHEIEEALYVPLPESLNHMEDKTPLFLAEKMKAPLTYIAASLVYEILEKMDIAQMLMKTAITLTTENLSYGMGNQK